MGSERVGGGGQDKVWPLSICMGHWLVKQRGIGHAGPALWSRYVRIYVELPSGYRAFGSGDEMCTLDRGLGGITTYYIDRRVVEVFAKDCLCAARTAQPILFTICSRLLPFGHKHPRG
jgi:hypothetical protein